MLNIVEVPTYENVVTMRKLDDKILICNTLIRLKYTH